MQRTLILILAAVFAIALLARAMTYTVRFTEAGVRTTFGSAEAENVRKEPGLYFKWPEPIQSVTKYDTRMRFLQTRLEAQQTADNRILVVEVYCMWRVNDPLQFFKRWSNAGPRAAEHYRKAEDVLRGALRDAMGAVSRYAISDLFTPTGQASKLPELEQRVLARFKENVANAAGDSVEAIDVGISRVIFPEATTEQVFDQMRETRATLVKEIESRGESQSKTIIDTAEQNSRRILNFAQNLAAEIRAKGDQEAQQYVAQMNENPEFAVFLKSVDFLREFVSKQTTLVFTTDSPIFEMFDLGVLKKAGASGVPGVNRLMNQNPESMVTGGGSPAPAGEKR